MDKKSCNRNPLRTANCINKLFFWWLKDIIGRAGKYDLEPNDIYNTMPEDLSEPLRHTLEIAWQSEINNAKLKSMEPSLTRVLVKTYCWTFLKYASLQALYVIALMIQPQLLEMIMLYFDYTSTMATSEAYAYATVSIILMAFQNAVLRQGAFQLNRLGMQIKLACSSLIFKKITKLPCSSTDLNKSASAISLLSVDVSRFEMLLSFLAFVVILPIQLAGVTYLIYLYVGLIAAISGVALMILQTIPLQTLYYKLTLKWRAKQTVNTDKRISLIEETVAGVRAIKMYTWENYFEKLMCEARRLEIEGYLKISYLLSAADSLLMISHRICSFTVTLIYFLQYRIITTENVLSVRQHFYNLRGNLSIYFFLGVQAIANVRVSIQRIKNFLLLSEVESSVKKKEDRESTGTISIKNIRASWDKKIKGNSTLHNVTIDFLPRHTHAIIGETGSGKSSLLKLLLGELEPISGEVSVGGEISYASQEPWLFAASIRENILFGEAYEAERYDEVVKACALIDDFNNLPYGDKTLVGDRGMSLSGGQRARINVARAVYRKADIYLLDDPFSAVDTRVAKTLRSQCVDALLKDKTVILVTHNLHYLNNSDHVVLMKRGRIEFEGNVIDFQKNNVISPLQSTSEINSTECTEDIDDYPQEDSQNDECKQLLSSSETNCIGCVEEKNDYSNNVKDGTVGIIKTNEDVKVNDIEEIMAKRSLSKLVILDYIKAGGNAALLMVLAANFFPTVLMYKFDFEMTAWTEEEGHYLRNQTLQFVNLLDQSVLHLHSMVVIGSILTLIVTTTIVKNILIYRFIYTANKNLHNEMFAHLIRTSLRFFDINPAGRVLNRFSEDIGNMDNAMPESLVDMFKTTFQVIGSLIFVLIINWWNLIPIALTTLIFVWMSSIYVTAIPKIKRLVGYAKSPVLTFVTSTLAGLTTIRSCKAENFILTEFTSRLDKHTAAFFLVLASSMAFAIWIEILTVSLFACTAYICIALKNNGILAGRAGLILMTIYEIITSVSYIVRVFADMCAHMVNVERVLQYTKLESESLAKNESEVTTNTKSSVSVLDSWPCNGEIRFERVNLRYSDEDQPVLNDLNFSIEPGTKVGIVGRTGAGKSSLITALFRLAKLDGRILIDNVDTKKIDLSCLRSKISIIPQEPVLFSASLRRNLDPLNEFDDTTLWSALDSVGIRQNFSSLDQLLERGGKNLSLGQRQLLCMARAAAKNNKILVLDEATANVDSATDALIQETIRDRFKSCTVLTIAHRLNTIMDSDKVLVMDHGRVVEYDHPHELLQNHHGIFLEMVEQTGESVSRHMRTIAKTVYDKLTVQSTYL